MTPLQVAERVEIFDQDGAGIGCAEVKQPFKAACIPRIERVGNVAIRAKIDGVDVGLRNTAILLLHVLIFQLDRFMHHKAVLLDGCACHVATMENMQALDDGAVLRAKRHGQRQATTRGDVVRIAQNLLQQRSERRSIAGLVLLLGRFDQDRRQRRRGCAGNADLCKQTSMVKDQGGIATSTPEMHFRHEYPLDLPNGGIRARFLFYRNRLKKVGFFLSECGDSSDDEPQLIGFGSSEASSRGWQGCRRRPEVWSFLAGILRQRHGGLPCGNRASPG